MKSIKEIRRNHFKRLMAGYDTQQQFADAVGVAQGQISLMISGNREIGNRVARRIEGHLGLPIGYMDHDVQTGTADPEILLTQLLSADQLILLKNYAKASPKHREMVREMASTYARLDGKQPVKAARSPKPPIVEGRCAAQRACGEMTSGEEARFYLNGGDLTGLDGDGTPCEALCNKG